MAKSVAFTEDAMRARFADLQDEVAAIENESRPLREKRDKVVNKARDEEKVLNEQIAAIERGTKKGENKLFNLKSELGMIVRALKGRVEGSAPIARTSQEPAPAETPAA